MSRAVAEYYNLLIDENNDPVYDPAPLREYMDLWDGPAFIQSMQIESDMSVLEIGVGTGRLALRTAPLCRRLLGVDLSPKTIARAKENLSGFSNTALLCGDFLTLEFSERFDVIYSSLTFMHIAEKQRAIGKASELLNAGGRFALSIDKNQDRFIDYGTRKIEIFPDSPKEIAACILHAGLTLIEQLETEHAHIFVAVKDSSITKQRENGR